MINKKKFILPLLWIYATWLFASDINFSLAEEADVSLEQHFEYRILQDSTSGPFSIAIDCNLNFDTLNITLGFSGESNMVNATISSFYAPLFFCNFRLGPASYFHYGNYKNNIGETDILLGIYFEDCKGNIFNFKAATFYHRKDAFLPYIRHSLPTNTLEMRLDFNWSYNHWNWDFTVTTYDLFDYPLFFSPIFVTYVEYSPQENLFFGLKLSSLWIDMLTIPANPTTFAADLYFRMVL